MKALAAFLAVNAVLAAANVIGALVALGLGSAIGRYAPEAADSSWTWLIVGYTAAGAGIAFAILTVRATEARRLQKGTKP